MKLAIASAKIHEIRDAFSRDLGPIAVLVQKENHTDQGIEVEQALDACLAG